MKWKIYFDMDGVLADFQRGVRELCGMEPTPLKGKRDAKYDDQMWAAIKEVDHFYGKLEIMPGAKPLFDTIYGKYGDQCEILTAVLKLRRGISHAETDKVEWVRQYLDEHVKVNIVMREDKPKYCTGKECILIDDMEKNIKSWQGLGGTGILYTTAEETLQKLQEADVL